MIKASKFVSEQFGMVQAVKLIGEVYFVGRHIARTLGYDDFIEAVDKCVAKADKRKVPIMCAGKEIYLTVINESGLYSLIQHSKSPRAKEFENWVTSEVLPVIRNAKR